MDQFGLTLHPTQAATFVVERCTIGLVVSEAGWHEATRRICSAYFHIILIDHSTFQKSNRNCNSHLCLYYMYSVYGTSYQLCMEKHVGSSLDCTGTICRVGMQSTTFVIRQSSCRETCFRHTYRIRTLLRSHPLFFFVCSALQQERLQSKSRDRNGTEWTKWLRWRLGCSVGSVLRFTRRRANRSKAVHKVTAWSGLS